MLAHYSLRLPPILYSIYRSPVTACSKAPRGLSVLSRVMSIFTHTTISPGPLLRQLPSRYAFRAGRNLPDKEFRYLRTVIVTAAVYWGLSSGLSPLPLTFQHRAGVSTYTSSSDFADTCVFGKQSLGTLLCGLSALLLPKLRSLFAEFLNKGSPARLWILSSPTCVGFRYGHLVLFSGFSRRLLPLLRLAAPLRFSASLRGTSLPSLRLHLDALYQPRAQIPSPRPRFIPRLGGIGLFTDCPSPTLSPRLRSRLPLGGLAFPRIP